MSSSTSTRSRPDGRRDNRNHSGDGAPRASQESTTTPEADAYKGHIDSFVSNALKHFERDGFIEPIREHGMR